MTDWSVFTQLFSSAALPVLPAPGVFRMALPVFWAVVLAFLTLRMTGRLSQTMRFVLVGGVAVWALLPGAVSVSYWLGLAFQMPSWMTLLLCAAGLVRLVSHMRAGPTEPFTSLGTTSSRVPPKRATQCTVWAAWIGIALGWLMFSDTFVLLPMAIYRWGFSTGVLAVFALCAAVLWAASGGFAALRQSGWAVAAWVPSLVVLALALFVVTRLPSGNVFDAMLDPWLWFYLHAHVVRRWWRARKVRS